MIKIQNKPIYRLTNHCRKRFYERIAELEWKGQSLIDKNIMQCFHKTPENLSWQNNIKFVEYLKNRYGSCKLKIMQNNDIIFICKRDEKIPNLYFIVTCFKPNTMNSFQV